MTSHVTISYEKFYLVAETEAHAKVVIISSAFRASFHVLIMPLLRAGFCIIPAYFNFLMFELFIKDVICVIAIALSCCNLVLCSNSC